MQKNQQTDKKDKILQKFIKIFKKTLA